MTRSRFCKSQDKFYIGILQKCNIFRELAMLELTPALHTTANSEGFAVLCNGPARNIDTLRAEQLNDLIITNNRRGGFFVNQDFDLVTHSFG
jgi:hypothetical protein